MKKIIYFLLAVISFKASAQGVQFGAGYAFSSGSITTQNLNPLTGVPTAGSFVALTLGNQSTMTINVSGTYTGVLSLQYSTDGGSTWVTYTNANQLVLETSGVPVATIASAATGSWTTDVAGLTNVRVSALAAVTGTAVVSLRAVSASQQIGINQALPTGTNSIGNIGTIGTMTPGTAATNLGKSRNLAIGATDVGVGILTLRNDALAAFGTTGNYNTPIADQFGSLIIKDEQRHKRTYYAAIVVTPATSASDIFQLIGSATTTVEITKITISGTQTTSGIITGTLLKRSTANTGGTSTSATLVPAISTDAAATAVCSVYTANPTALGTNVGAVKTFLLAMPAVASANISSVEFNFQNKPIQLSGVAQALVFNLGGSTTIAGGSFNISIEFTEF